MKSFAMISLLAGLAMATNHETPGYVAPTPDYVAPAPEHVAPAPEYVAPAPEYVAPAPEYVAPAPEYVAPAEHVAPPAHEQGAPKVHKINVGGANPGAKGGEPVPILKYDPESIKANVGDIVEFHFWAKNHTVTQSTFADPCKKMDGGFDSNFQPNPENKEGVVTTYTVETTEPLWFYCKQRTGNHCGKGMVFAINAADTGDKTFEIWKGLAIAKNGTELEGAPIVENPPAPAPSTVSAAAEGHVTQTAHVAAPTVAVGEGIYEDGAACSCHCLCGANTFPADLGVNNWGGYAGMLSV